MQDRTVLLQRAAALLDKKELLSLSPQAHPCPLLTHFAVLIIAFFQHIVQAGSSFLRFLFRSLST